jgi:hypothetical protein
LVGKSEGRRSLETSTYGLEDNIEMDLMEKKFKVNWIHLAQGRGWRRALVSMVINLRAP